MKPTSRSPLDPINTTNSKNNNNNNNNNKLHIISTKRSRRKSFLLLLLCFLIIIIPFCLFFLPTTNGSEQYNSFNNGREKAYSLQQQQQEEHRSLYDPLNYYFGDKTKQRILKKEDPKYIDFLRAFITSGYETESEKNKWRRRQNIVTLFNLKTFLFSFSGSNTLVINNEDGVWLNKGNNINNNNNNNNNVNNKNPSDVTVLKNEEFFTRQSRFADPSKASTEKKLQAHMNTIQQAVQLVQKQVQFGEEDNQKGLWGKKGSKRENKKEGTATTTTMSPLLSLEYALIAKSLTKYLLFYHKYLFQDHGLAMLYLDTLAAQIFERSVIRKPNPHPVNIKDNNNNQADAVDDENQFSPSPRPFFKSKTIHFVELRSRSANDHFTAENNNNMYSSTFHVLKENYFPYLFLTFPEIHFHTVYADEERYYNRNDLHGEDQTSNNNEVEGEQQQGEEVEKHNRKRAKSANLNLNSLGQSSTSDNTVEGGEENDNEDSGVMKKSLEKSKKENATTTSTATRTTVSSPSPPPLRKGAVPTIAAVFQLLPGFESLQLQDETPSSLDVSKTRSIMHHLVSRFFLSKAHASNDVDKLLGNGELEGNNLIKKEQKQTVGAQQDGNQKQNQKQQQQQQQQEGEENDEQRRQNEMKKRLCLNSNDDLSFNATTSCQTDDYYFYIHFDYLSHVLFPYAIRKDWQSSKKAAIAAAAAAVAAGGNGVVAAGNTIANQMKDHVMEAHEAALNARRQQHTQQQQEAQQQVLFENFIRQELLGMCMQGRTSKQQNDNNNNNNNNNAETICSQFGSPRSSFIIELPNPFLRSDSAFPSYFEAASTTASPDAAAAAGGNNKEKKEKKSEGEGEMEEGEENEESVQKRKAMTAKDDAMGHLADALQRWYAPFTDQEKEADNKDQSLQSSKKNNNNNNNKMSTDQYGNSIPTSPSEKKRTSNSNINSNQKLRTLLRSASFSSPYQYHQSIQNQKYNFDTFLQQVLSIIINKDSSSEDEEMLVNVNDNNNYMNQGMTKNKRSRKQKQNKKDEQKRKDPSVIDVHSYNQTRKHLMRNWRVVLLTRVYGAYSTDGQQLDGVKDVYVIERELEALE